MSYANLRIGRYSANGMTYHITTVTKNRMPFFRDLRAYRGVSTEGFAGRRPSRNPQLCAHAGSSALVDDASEWRAAGSDAIALGPYRPCGGPSDLATELSRPRHTQGRGSTSAGPVHRCQSTSGWAGRADWGLPLVGCHLAGCRLVGLKPDLQLGCSSLFLPSISSPLVGRASARQTLPRRDVAA